MVLSAIFILDSKGKSLIARNFRGDVPMGAIDDFVNLVSEAEEEGEVPPILMGNGINYMYIRHNLLYFVALTRKNSNASLIFMFLKNLCLVFKEYFREVNEESIMDNFVVIYELLDEMLDFGYPQTTEPKILREYITQKWHRMEITTRPPMAVTNAVSWRTDGIKYRKNEVFLDVVESVNMMASSSGQVLSSEILGVIKMRCYLSGMPELKLGLNDKCLFEGTRTKSVEMEDVKFHQCVRLAKFEDDRTISFIPPDGDFELMSYRLNTQVKPLIWCDAVVEIFSGTRIEFMIKAKSQFKRRSSASNVEIHVPVPTDADSPKFKTSTGSVCYAPEKNMVIWKIKQMPGGAEALMRAHFGLPTVRSEELDLKPPISVKFEIPYFTVSGIQVKYLKVVERSGYQALPWVRYISQNGSYQMRMPEAVTGQRMTSL